MLQIVLLVGRAVPLHPNFPILFYLGFSLSGHGGDRFNEPSFEKTLSHVMNHQADLVLLQY